MHLLTLAGNARNSTAQAEESLASLEREAERLNAEMSQARNEQETLGVQSGQARLRFESAAETLKRLESEIAELREQLQSRRTDEGAARARANQFRSEQATVAGRHDSLQSLIRDHSYSTETVRKLLRPGALQNGSTPVGTLADFIEVSGEHEGVVDEFLRDELNYVVVKSWHAAEEGVRVLKSGVDGRATFLIHDTAQAGLFNDAEDMIARPGVTPLKDAVRVLNGFGRSLETILPKLRDGYLVETAELAQTMANDHAHAYFLTPEGECFHNATVTGGKPASAGPLVLKRELRETEMRLAALDRDLGQAEMEAATLTRQIEELTARLEGRSEERRLAEREAADQGAALKQMENEAQRIERRMQEWLTQAARNKEAREAKHVVIEQKREEAVRLEAERATAEAGLEEQQNQLGTMRQTRETLQHEAAKLTAELAGLEERRRGAESAFQRIDRLHTDLERRVLGIEQQRAAAEAEREQRIKESAELALRGQELTTLKADALAQAEVIAAQAHEVRHQLAELETQLKNARAALDQLRDDRSGRSSQAAKLRSDLE